MTIILRLALSASTLALAMPAVAQEAPTDDDIVVTAQRENATEVTRGGQVGVLGDKDAADVPFSIKSYNEALILNQQPQTLGQVLENDPGIRITYGFGNAAEQFVIRGFALYGDDIALNGLYGVTPRQLVSPELYQSVQVLNGANAFLNGAAPAGSAIGGSVNLVTKRAGDKPLTRVTASYIGSAHFGGAFDLARRSADGAFGLRINGAYRAGDVSIDNEFRRSAVIGAGLDWRGDRARVMIDLAYQRVTVRNLRPKVTLSPTLTAVPRVPDSDTNYGQRFAYSTLRDVFGTVRGEYDLSDNAMVYAAFGARDGSERGIYDGVTVLNAVTGAANGNDLFVPRTDNNEAAQAGIRIRLAGSGLTHEFNLGGSAIRQVNRNAYDFLYGPGFAGYATNIYTPPAATLPASAFAGGNLNDPYPVGRTQLNSVFASDTIGAFGDRLFLVAGLRLQTIKSISYSYSGGAETDRYDDSAVTPVVGLVIKPAAGVSLFANRIEALQAGTVAPAGTINVGEIFAPYRSTQYEVGGKLAFGRFNASLAAYTTTQPSAYAVPVAGSALFRFGVFGEQRNRGIELSVDGELAEGLRVIAGGSILDAKLRRTAGGTNDGNRAQGVPTYLANANVEWDLPFVRGATLTGRVVNTGRQEVNPANTLDIPNWTRVDLGARYVTIVGDKPLTFRLTVDNVADRRYWSSAFDVFNSSLLQGAPRTVKLSASIDL